MKKYYISIERQGSIMWVVKVNASSYEEAETKALKAVHLNDDITDIDEETVKDMLQNGDIDFIIDEEGDEIGIDEEENDCGLPKEITVTLDDLSLEDIDDEDEVVDAISDYLSDTYGFCHKGFMWERGDDVDTINIYNIDWDTSGDEESDDEDGDYLIVEEDGTKHYYDDEPDVDVIHGFVCGECVDITIYKKTEDGDWEEVDSYHA